MSLLWIKGFIEDGNAFVLMKIPCLFTYFCSFTVPLECVVEKGIKDSEDNCLIFFCCQLDKKKITSLLIEWKKQKNS